MADIWSILTLLLDSSQSFCEESRSRRKCHKGMLYGTNHPQGYNNRFLVSNTVAYPLSTVTIITIDTAYSHGSALDPDV